MINKPPVSILKPICGVDENLYGNLVSFVAQNYPKFEIIFGVEDAKDAALEILYRIIRQYPLVDLKIVVHGEKDNFANPKVISLIHMEKVAKYDHIVISDSNVLVGANYLSNLVAEMEKQKVGIVSNLIIGSGENSIGAICENFHLNTLIYSTVVLADKLKIPCVIGKSMLIKRSQLNTLGGFESLRNVLAEDYILGVKYSKAGYKIALSKQPITTCNKNIGLNKFVTRHLRWMQLRRSTVPVSFFFEPLLYPSFSILSLALFNHKLIGISIILLLLRILWSSLVHRLVTKKLPSLLSLLLIPVKDILLLGCWYVSNVKSVVSWRGHKIKINKGSLIICNK